MTSDANSDNRLGRDVARRFAPRRGVGRGRGLGLGTLAASTARFVTLNGRSMAVRRMLGGSMPIAAWSTGGLPVRLAPDSLFASAIERERPRAHITVSWEEQQMQVAMAARARAAGRVAGAGVAGVAGLP